MAKKVLIIDDEPMIVKVLGLRFEQHGYAVASAFNGEEGLEAVKREKPDLILLDIGIPIIDGNTLCELIKNDKALKHIPVIMLTGKKLVGDMEDAFKAGADVYISKPYDWHRLLEHVKKLVGPA